MKTIYFDCFSGVSGDMCLGALIDAGCPVEALSDTLGQMKLPGFGLSAERVRRKALTGTRAHVAVEEEPRAHRTLADVLELVDRASWPGDVRERIEEAFTRLARAEGLIHDRPYDEIHFHEVGSYDAIIDISGAMLGFHLMGVTSFACSKIHVGQGTITGTRHGEIPLPPPAAAEMLKGFDLYSTGKPRELVTPTGAAIVSTLSNGSSPMPSMKIDAIGYGAGGRDDAELANLLRIFVGDEAPGGADRVVVVEANIDDMNPEWFQPLMQSLFGAGAVDVALVPAQMKKSRAGTIVTAIAPLESKDKVAAAMLCHSSSIGVRMHECERRTLERKTVTVETPFGPVEGKVVWGHGVQERFSPEYDACKRIHDRQGAPIAHIYEAASRAYADGRTETEES